VYRRQAVRRPPTRRSEAPPGPAPPFPAVPADLPATGDGPATARRTRQGARFPSTRGSGVSFHRPGGVNRTTGDVALQCGTGGGGERVMGTRFVKVDKGRASRPAPPVSTVRASQLLCRPPISVPIDHLSVRRARSLNAAGNDPAIREATGGAAAYGPSFPILMKILTNTIICIENTGSGWHLRGHRFDWLETRSVLHDTQVIPFGGMVKDGKSRSDDAR